MKKFISLVCVLFLGFNILGNNLVFAQTNNIIEDKAIDEEVKVEEKTIIEKNSDYKRISNTQETYMQAVGTTEGDKVRFKLEVNNSYVLVNTTDNRIEVLLEKRVEGSSWYVSSKVGSNYHTEVYRNPSAYAGGELRVSLKNGVADLLVPKEYASMVKTVASPAAYEVPLTLNTSFDYYNPEKNNITFGVIGQSLEYRDMFLTCEKEGTSISKIYATTSPSVSSADESIRFGMYEGAGSILIPYELRENVKIFNNPAVRSMTLVKGGIYEFQGKDTGFGFSINDTYDRNNDLGYDFVYYDANGKVQFAFCDYKSIRNYVIKQNEKRIIKATSGSATIYYAYESTGYIKKITEDPYTTITLKPGETFNYKRNLMNIHIKIRDQLLTNRFDVASYNEYGEPVSAEKNVVISEVHLRPDTKIKETDVTNNGTTDLSLYMVKEVAQEFTKVNYKALNQMKLTKGDNIIFNSKLKIPVLYESVGRPILNYDVVVLYAYSSAVKFIEKDYKGPIPTEDSSKTHITMNGDNDINIFYPYKCESKITKTTNKALSEIKLSKYQRLVYSTNYKREIKVILEDGVNFDTVTSESPSSGLEIRDEKVDNFLQYSDVQLTPVEKDTIVYVPSYYKDYLQVGSGTSIVKLQMISGKPLNLGNTNMDSIWDAIKFRVKPTNEASKVNIKKYDSKGNLLDEKIDVAAFEYSAEFKNKTVVELSKGTQVELQYPREYSKYVAWSQDLNTDRKIDVTDLSLVTSLYNVQSEKDNYNVVYDLDTNKVIDLYDIVNVAKKIK